MQHQLASQCALYIFVDQHLLVFSVYAVFQGLTEKNINTTVFCKSTTKIYSIPFYGIFFQTVWSRTPYFSESYCVFARVALSRTELRKSSQYCRGKFSGLRNEFVWKTIRPLSLFLLCFPELPAACESPVKRIKR